MQESKNISSHGTTRWSHYQIAYHFVWIPKYRRKVLLGPVQRETKRLIYECAEKHGFRILALETDEDHVHCFASCPPRWSPAKVVGYLKGYTSRYLRAEFPWLKKKCETKQLWTQAYYVGTAGSVSQEIIRRYINECQGL
ncbi:MAG: IS200/IS605 family transposase [Deltaproteobacteria bacterium]|nr:IS200/IS605 family transposase [Deltaproteobacteria bacterium]